MTRRMLALTLAAVAAAVAVATPAAAQAPAHYFETYAHVETVTTTVPNIFGLPQTTTTTVETPRAGTLGPYHGLSAAGESALAECERYRAFYEGLGYRTLGCRQ